jgi:hypothetical protein
MDFDKSGGRVQAQARGLGAGRLPIPGARKPARESQRHNPEQAGAEDLPRD